MSLQFLQSTHKGWVHAQNGLLNAAEYPCKYRFRPVSIDCRQIYYERFSLGKHLNTEQGYQKPRCAVKQEYQQNGRDLLVQMKPA